MTTLEYQEARMNELLAKIDKRMDEILKEFGADLKAAREEKKDECTRSTCSDAD